MDFDGETGRSMKSCHMNHHGEGGREGEGGEGRKGEGGGRGGGGRKGEEGRGRERGEVIMVREGDRKLCVILISSFIVI